MPIVAKEHEWAYELLVQGFEERILEYLSEERIRRKIHEQSKYSDEMYEAMLRTAAGRKHFVSMMTYWSVGQGIAVALRNWVEDLIKELVIHENGRSRFGHPIAYAYTLKDLKRYAYTDNPDAIAPAGETETEHSQNRTWDVSVRSRLVQQAELITKFLVERHRHKGVVEDVRGLAEMGRWTVRRNQQQHLFDTAVHISEESAEVQRLICNLLVIEQPPGKICAFRFASPKLSAERDLAHEKRNLLLLYGWLRQEKPLRLKTDAVETYWAHLFPRPIADAQRWYFDENEVMTFDRFWDFVGVPFSVVQRSLETAGVTLSKHIGKLVRRMSYTSVAKQLKAEGKQMSLTEFY